MSIVLDSYELWGPIRNADGGWRAVARNTTPNGDGKYYALAVAYPVPANVTVAPTNALGPYDTIDEADAVLDTVTVPVPTGAAEPGA
jgi:hypothetical protein